MDIGKNHARTDTNIPMWLCALIGGGIGLGVIVVFALLSPLLILRTDDPNSMTAVFAAVSVFSGGAVGAFISANRAKSFVSGMLSSVVIIIPMLLVSLLTSETPEWSSALISLIATISASALGAYIATAMGKNKKRNMKKAMKRRRG